jgi:hypothetical protein
MTSLDIPFELVVRDTFVLLYSLPTVTGISANTTSVFF